mmetsp:Transcript_26886/g.43899  ORF Transcript_26886/g.43899 Transcript_26886/m.43899 type:complete len:261 (+) Transcript_26886:141-923(+)
MALQAAIFGLLVTEIVLCFLISIPLPTNVKARIVRYISSSLVFERIRNFFQLTFVFIIVLCFDATRESIEVNRKKHDLQGALGMGTTAELNARMFRAQRNAYIDGFAILMMLVLNRFFQFIKENVRLSQDLSMVKKQAEGTKTAYMSLLEEHSALEAKHNKLLDELGVGEEGAGATEETPEAKTSEGDIELKAVKDEKLRQRRRTAADKLLGADIENEKLKKEMKAHEERIKKLEKENERLNDRLEDYNTLFDDTGKKNA